MKIIKYTSSHKSKFILIPHSKNVVKFQDEIEVNLITNYYMLVVEILDSCINLV